MAIRAQLITVTAEYVVMSIAAAMYSNRVDDQADRFVIATLNIICALMDTPGIVVLVVNLFGGTL